MKIWLWTTSIVFSILLSAATALAHNFTVDIDDLTIGGAPYSVEHQESAQDGYGGWVTINVTNTGTDAWGDFHFSFYPVPGYDDISDLHWTDAASSQSFTYSIDNVSNNATLDLYFYGDPLLPGESGFFSGYSDNQDELSWFGVAVYPTPVPVPAAVWLLGSGLLGLAGFRRRWAH